MRRFRAALFGIGGVVLLGVLWEVYKALAPAAGFKIGAITVLPRTSDAAGSTIITTKPPATAYSNKYVDAALKELKAEGVDVMGTSYKPLTVVLKEGGK